MALFVDLETLFHGLGGSATMEYSVDPGTGQVVVHGYKINNTNRFTNWDRFRICILYVLNKDETYSLYPKEKEVIQPKPKTS